MPFLDPNTKQGAKAQALLDDALVVWLTTVAADGRPQASPVWFLVDDDEFLVYSLDGTPRTRNIADNSQVALNLDSNAGSDVVSVEGTARISDDPPSTANDRYQAKYAGPIDDIGHTPQSFAEAYPVPIRITPEKWRVW